jgi:hypothetical protein
VRLHPHQRICGRCCDNPISENSVLSPKLLHLVIKIFTLTKYSSLFLLKIIMKGFIYSSLYSDCVQI